MMLQGKKILLGVTAGIAVYKSASLIRLLIGEGAEVKVIMTPMARKFISPVTFSVLSGNPVSCDFFSETDGTWYSHIELGSWADLFLIAPLTACTMGKMVNGIADNLLVATWLAARCPVILAPAMDVDMYQHPSTKRNLEILQSYGNQIIEPATGELASGLYGKGRMEEPEKIISIVIEHLQGTKPEKKKPVNLTGLRILITAGPTHEPVDPVRYIGNNSSGKMGYALAQAAGNAGAVVTLISGPVNLPPPPGSIKLLKVTTADEMYETCMNEFAGCDVAIMAAAVADYTPESYSSHKMKKAEEEWCLKLRPTKDIAAELGKRKKEKQVLIGFALETENELQHALEKIKRKNLDFIVLNSLNDPGAGFGYETNKVTIIDKHNKMTDYGLKTKEHAANDILIKLMDYVKQA
jgi:phosphopantothenoylcysteine decarboxylase/phosphopantothenate--cysteine ligase